MNLAIVTETFPPEVNGVAMTFGVIARKLAQRGHKVTIHRPSRPDLDTHGAEHQAYRVLTWPGFGIPGYSELRMGFPSRRRFKELWTHDRPDLVHVVTEGPLGASAVSAARKLDIPVTSSFHTNFHAYARHYGFSLLNRITLAWLRRVHNRTRRTFAPTRELCSQLEGDGFERTGVLSRGVDLDKFNPARRSIALRAEWGAGPGRPVVLHVGRMAPEKNYPLLFRIFAEMRKANPDLVFVLAGEGPLRASLVREHPECHFLGFLSREEIGRVFASSEIYVHASTTETFGNVLTEALASGLAVVGYNYAAAGEFIQEGTNGITVPLGDEKALTEAAVRLAVDASLRERLGRKAPEAVANQSWDQVVNRFERDLISEVRKESR